MDAKWQVFAWIVENVQGPLSDSIQSATNGMLAAASGPLRACAVLYVMLIGILILRGHMEEAGPTLIGRFLKLGIILWMVTSGGAYTSYVFDFFFNTMPGWLSDAAAGGGTPVAANTFDQLWLQSWDAGLTTWRSLDMMEIAEKGIIILFWFAAFIACVVCFGIWLISRFLLGLYIVIGPVVIVLALFPATRGFLERWIGAMAGQIVLQVGANMVLAILMVAMAQIVGGMSGSAGEGGDAWARLQTLFAACILYAVGAFVVLQLPGWASSLAGGLSFHTGALARAAFGNAGNAAAGAAGAAGKAAAAAGRAGAAGFAARQAANGGGTISNGGGGSPMRPAPGPSLS